MADTARLQMMWNYKVNRGLANFIKWIVLFISGSSQAAAFEMNVDNSYVLNSLKSPTIQSIPLDSNVFVNEVAMCVYKNKLFVGGIMLHNGERGFPSKRFKNYVLTRNSDSTFSLTLRDEALPPKRRKFPLFFGFPCHKLYGPLLPVNDINGFTDMENFFKWLIKRGYN